jgi:quinoprotein glucose dehydrogenase
MNRRWDTADRLGCGAGGQQASQPTPGSAMLPAHLVFSVWLTLTEPGIAMFRSILTLISLFLLAHGFASAADAQSSVDWRVYDGDTSGDHYSSLKQIDRNNVQELTVAWKFDTGERGGLETNPVIVGHVLFAFTPSHKVIALDAASGKLIWKFDPGIPGRGNARAVSYWTDGHQSRILAGITHFLYALDATTGKSIPTFGEDGRVDLRKGLGEDYRLQSISLSSPGVVYKDLIIVGGGMPETHPAPPGDVRAFDVRTGALRWTFHTIPRPGEFGYSTWPTNAWKDAGAANNWAGMSLDAERGIVYVPTGSAVFDFYGGDRIGDDLFSDTLLALDAQTGKRIWHFLGVHHDLWDRDFPAPPALLTVVRKGRKVDAVAQTTKSGYIFLFDRETGKPLFPIKEAAYPASHVPGEVTAPTQPLPTMPAPFARQTITEDMLTNRTPEAHAWAEKQFKTFASGGQFTPLSVDKLTVMMPGMGGGAEWGGPAVDRKTGVIYVNSNEMPRLVGITAPATQGSPGELTYQSQCSGCHGVDRSGAPPDIPSLLGIDGLLTNQEIEDTIRQGKGRMPAFSNLTGEQINLLIHYLIAPAQPRRPPGATPPAAMPAPVANSPRTDMPYDSMGRRRFVDPEGYPAIVPPWGTLSAIDLNTGKYLWKVPLGQYPELVAKGMRDTGSDNYGGPIVTAGGLVFIGATVFDQKFRAFDSSSGKLLWETELPYSGLATPATYMIDGKQYVVIAAGGGQTNPKPSGGVYVAFTLP